MPDPIYNVLFLCTTNSARSLLAEAILNRIGRGRFIAFSAGVRPRGGVNPYALNLLHLAGHDASLARSKDWNEFASPAGPRMDFVLTLCVAAVNEACPVWPGQPVTAHWSIPDPEAVKGDRAEVALAFDEAYRMMGRRIELFLALPLGSIDRLALRGKLREIGAISDAGASTAAH